MDNKFVPKVEQIIPSTVDLTDQMLPAIRDWKVGEQYSIKLLVEQISSQKGSIMNPNDKTVQRATFKVIGAESCEPEDQPMTKQIENSMQATTSKEAFMRAVHKYLGD